MGRVIIKVGNDEYNEYIDGQTIDYISTLGKKETISKKLLRSFLSNDELYNELHNVIVDEGYRIEVSFSISQIGTRYNSTINVADLLTLLNQFSDLNKEEEARYDSLKKICSLEKLKSTYENEKIILKIQDKDYEFNCIDLLKVLFASDERFNEYVNSDNIFGYDKRMLFYAINKLIRRNKIMERYYVPRKYVNRYSQIRKHEIIDYESVDIFDIKNNLRADIKLNPLVKQKIYGDMNPEYSDIEKCIYIYVKLCKMFSYDYEFFINGQKGQIADVHMNPDRIYSIKDSEDLIVCYEFIFMYVKFLEELGIDYVINSKGIGTHANLNFVVDKYIVHADAVSSILSGDLINAKLNFKLTGIQCVNESVTTRRDFDEILIDIYRDVIEEGNNDEKLDDAIAAYRSLKYQEDSYKSLSVKERINLLFDQIKDCQLKKIEGIGYLIRLKHLLFTDKELDKNVNIVSMVNNNTPFIVITTNEKDYTNSVSNTEYWYYIYGKSRKIKKISKSRLLQLLDSKTIKYVPGTKLLIPGIGEGRK